MPLRYVVHAESCNGHTPSFQLICFSILLLATGYALLVGMPVNHTVEGPIAGQHFPARVDES